jgi:hypothetical protein
LSSASNLRDHVIKRLFAEIALELTGLDHCDIEDGMDEI